ncbi:MAG: restriction endonuclease subunit S [Deltaproteobacteria bacterium]|nr:MAG: restriction endonuclease subunit S [Deltaproteobacteria bacterium]
MKSECQLKDICEVTSGQAAPQGDDKFSDQGIPFIRAGSLESLLNESFESKLELVKLDVAKSHGLKLFPKDTILFAKSGMSAKIGRIYRLKEPSYVVSHLAAVIPGSQVDSSYLQRWFEYNPPSRLIPNDSYPSIRTSEIGNLKINLPSISEQRRIATILDKADALRRKRAETIKLLDQFLRSVFLEIFGDPVRNEKGWSTKRLDEVAGIGSGIAKGKKYLGKKVVEVPYVRVANVQAGYLDMTEIKTIKVTGDEADKCALKLGDVLMTEGGDWDKLGRGAIWNYPLSPCIHQNHIFRVRCNKTLIIPAYLEMLLQTHYAKYFFQKASNKRQTLRQSIKPSFLHFPY